MDHPRIEDGGGNLSSSRPRRVVIGGERSDHYERERRVSESTREEKGGKRTVHVEQRRIVD